MSIKITSLADLDRELQVADILANFEFNNMNDIYVKSAF